MKALGVERTVELFEAEGVADEGRGQREGLPGLGPGDGKCWRHCCGGWKGRGRHCAATCPALTVEPREGGGFDILLPDATVAARRVVVASGGQSYPGCGTTGDGYAIARRFGHTIVEPRPALVPLRVDADWVPGLKGLTIPDAVARIQGPAGPPLSERGARPVLFAHFGLTGPAILDVSRAVARHDGPTRLDLVLDFAPEMRPEALDRHLRDGQPHRPATGGRPPARGPPCAARRGPGRSVGRPLRPDGPADLSRAMNGSGWSRR